ncbi:hypothetical protein JK635_02170 [Neobacillus sp. YIM B02564]|uniref:AbrB family transcriptional regulator n=1 Tax=Neobacillus paridis TaxID=2803862 RepID=A0ABS1TMC2_9BACI|nr:hypothetical protein [Neobacillus paridis]MBL4951045.1 hypothetical protein [Neobacillus paridis]
MEVKLSGNNVVIKLPVDLLVDAFNFKEDNQEVYEVKYKRKFAQGVVDYLKNHTSDSEAGLTAFQELLDEVFEEMTGNDENYIKSIEEDYQ